MNLVTVHRAFSPAEAQLVWSRLEAAGFDATVTHELASMSMEGYSLGAGGVLVQVPDNEAAEARELLASEAPPSPPEP
jgi:hypothetical protein